jgi:hypothetical protein
LQLPRHIVEGLRRHSKAAIRMVDSSPAEIRASLLAVQDQLQLSAEDRHLLLDFLPSDSLLGLKLLPLHTGKPWST